MGSERWLGIDKGEWGLESGTMVEVTVRDCVFCFDESVEHGCHFMRGVIEGMADVAYNSLHSSKVKCSDDINGYLEKATHALQDSQSNRCK